MSFRKNRKIRKSNVNLTQNQSNSSTSRNTLPTIIPPHNTPTSPPSTLNSTTRKRKKSSRILLPKKRQNITNLTSDHTSSSSTSSSSSSSSSNNLENSFESGKRIKLRPRTRIQIENSPPPPPPPRIIENTHRRILPRFTRRENIETNRESGEDDFVFLDDVINELDENQEERSEENEEEEEEEEEENEERGTVRFEEIDPPLTLNRIRNRFLGNRARSERFMYTPVQIQMLGGGEGDMGEAIRRSLETYEQEKEKDRKKRAKLQESFLLKKEKKKDKKKEKEVLSDDEVDEMVNIDEIYGTKTKEELLSEICELKKKLKKSEKEVNELKEKQKCRICFEKQVDTVMTCGHCYCRKCYNGLIKKGNGKCAFCFKSISKENKGIQLYL